MLIALAIATFCLQVIWEGIGEPVMQGVLWARLKENYLGVAVSLAIILTLINIGVFYVMWRIGRDILKDARRLKQEAENALSQTETMLQRIRDYTNVGR